MPVRSTPFQRVVFHIQRQLAGNADVQESALLADRSTGSNREVDVVIRSMVGEHQVVICVECQEHTRSATVEWVEQMAMKHSSLPTSKLILMTARGFSKAARAKAASLGIETYSFDEAVATDWMTHLGEGPNLSFDLWGFRILTCGIVLNRDGTEGHERKASPDVRVFNGDGTFRGTLNDIVRAYTEQSDHFTSNAMEYAAKAAEPVIGVEMRVRPPLFAEDKSGVVHEVKLIRIYLEARVISPDVRLKATRYRGAPVAYGQGQSRLGEFALTMIQTTGGTPTGAMSVTDPTTKAVQTLDIRFPEDCDAMAFITDRFKRSGSGEIK